MGDDKTFLLPDLGEGLTEGDVVRWLVEPGDAVAVDQPVAEIETAKAVVEVPSPYAGTVLALHADPGDQVAVGEPLLTVDVTAAAPASSQPAADATGTDETAPAAADTDAGATGAAEAPAPPVDTAAGADSDDDHVLLVGTGAKDRPRRRHRRAAGHGGGNGQARRHTDAGAADPAGRPLAKPPVRKLAKDLGIDLADVPASGPGGVITREDVETFAERGGAGVGQSSSDVSAAAPPSAADPLGLIAEAADRPDPQPGGPELVERRPLTGTRRAIAAQMARSRAEIPEAVTWVDCDATELMRTREELNRARTRSRSSDAATDDEAPGARVSPLALILRACVAGLRRFPELNSRLDAASGEIVVQRFVNLGVATQTPAGLMVPVVHGAERMSTLELAAELARLTTAARDRTITPAELRGSTFTVSNYGSFGVDGGDMVINFPEAAILGVGRIAERPWVVDGAVCARQVVTLALAFDHRVCDGGEAGGFLRFVADCVESPERMLAEL